VDEQIEKMLELLVRRENECFEGFCRGLEANDQGGIVQRYLQPYRVCFVSYNLRDSGL